MSVLRLRITTAVVLGALLVALLLYTTPVVAGLVLGIVMLVGAWEWSGFLRLESALPRCIYVALLAGIALLGQRELAGSGPFMHLMELTLLWWLVALCWVVIAPAHCSALGVGFAGVLALVPAWLALVRIDSTWSRGGEWTLFILTLAFAADTGAFFAGRRFGRVHLAPRVSPGKTWEGALGGMAVAALVSLAGAWWFVQPPSVFVPLCVGAAALSIVGDLTESLFKRRAGLKDSGRLFPGHGGVLDRIDSVTSAAPAMAAGLVWLGVGA
jgi:phosphatidate cytidylyltransferase